MKKKIYYIRMENNEYCDIKVLAKNIKEAKNIAQSNSYICQTSGSNFEVGETSDEAFFTDDPDIKNPTEDNPIVLVCSTG
jgi:hypothetical protein